MARISLTLFYNLVFKIHFFSTLNTKVAKGMGVGMLNEFPFTLLVYHISWEYEDKMSWGRVSNTNQLMLFISV